MEVKAKEGHGANIGNKHAIQTVLGILAVASTRVIHNLGTQQTLP